MGKEGGGGVGVGGHGVGQLLPSVPMGVTEMYSHCNLNS